MGAAYAALSLADRTRAAANPMQGGLWLLGGSAAMGIGIWSMHYLGMLAVKLSVPVYYHWPTVLVSLTMAIAASFAALLTIIGNRLGWRRLLCGSLLMGEGHRRHALHRHGRHAMRRDGAL
jgi:NO-binding membrane sensor protein with MHYT domain